MIPKLRARGVLGCAIREPQKNHFYYPSFAYSCSYPDAKLKGRVRLDEVKDVGVMEST
jgi:hypothetical protein